MFKFLAMIVTAFALVSTPAQAQGRSDEQAAAALAVGIALGIMASKVGERRHHHHYHGGYAPRHYAPPRYHGGYHYRPVPRYHGTVTPYPQVYYLRPARVCHFDRMGRQICR